MTETLKPNDIEVSKETIQIPQDLLIEALLAGVREAKTYQALTSLRAVKEALTPYMTLAQRNEYEDACKGQIHRQIRFNGPHGV